MKEDNVFEVEMQVHNAIYASYIIHHAQRLGALCVEALSDRILVLRCVHIFDKVSITARDFPITRLGAPLLPHLEGRRPRLGATKVSKLN